MEQKRDEGHRSSLWKHAVPGKGLFVDERQTNSFKSLLKPPLQTETAQRERFILLDLYPVSVQMKTRQSSNPQIRTMSS